jgi:hypothetical protein
MEKLKKAVNRTVRAALFTIAFYTISFGVAYAVTAAYDKLFTPKSKDKESRK